MKRRLVAAAVLMVAALSPAASAQVGPGTDIPGGVLISDTTWTRSGNPYRIHGTVEVPAGVTLRVRPGVRILARDNISRMFLVQGEVRALSAVTNTPIRIDGGDIASVFSTEGATKGSYIRVQNAEISNAQAIIADATDYSRFDLYDSTIADVTSESTVAQPGKSHVSRNVFQNSAGWAVMQGRAPVLFENNRFVGESLTGAWIKSYGSVGPSTQVHRNTFEPAGVIAVELVRDEPSGALDATSNYWSTISPSTIQTMILDRNDDFDRYNYIPFQPYLTAPDPGTP